MIEKIKEEVLEIYKKLEDAGFEVYFVGGCVRSLLLGFEKITDWDFTTNATPDEIQKLFPDSFYDNTFGTVGVSFEKSGETNPDEPSIKNFVEVTTYRTEHGYEDKRHPKNVKWGKTLEEDLKRRDFTINAIALKLKTNDQRLTAKIVDPLNGQEDLKKKLIRAVGDPNERFKEDALRLLRAVRFATQLDFTIEEKTWEAVVQDNHLISHIAGERIRDELLKILASTRPYEGIMLLDKSELLSFIIPELMKGKGISQERPGRHHKSDVFTHNVLSLKYCPSEDPIVKLATLLHDIGKVDAMSFDENNLVTFYNHEVIGARIAKNIAEKLRLSKKQKEKIYTLIRWHMFTVDENITDSAVRRFIRRVGIENVGDMMDLRIGDRLGGGTQQAESWRLKKFKERIVKELNPPFSINDLRVNGYDVMRQLNIKPGPQVGKVLKTLFEEVDEDLSKNNREYLLKRIKEVA